MARAIITTVLDNDTLEWIADTIMETAKRMEEQSKLGYYQDRLKAVQKQIDNIVRAVELGVVAEEINSRLTQLRADKQTIQGKIAAEKMNLLQVDREHVVYYLEQLRDGNPSDPKFQKRLVRDFVRAVYVYDDHFKLVVDFTGRNATFNVPMPPGNDSCDSYDSCDTSLYRESNPPPYHPYTNPRHGSVTAAGQGFVIAWYFER